MSPLCFELCYCIQQDLAFQSTCILARMKVLRCPVVNYTNRWIFQGKLLGIAYEWALFSYEVEP